VNSLPKTVTRQRRSCDLNPGPSVPESSMLTTQLPSRLVSDLIKTKNQTAIENGKMNNSLVIYTHSII